MSIIQKMMKEWQEELSEGDRRPNEFTMKDVVESAPNHGKWKIYRYIKNKVKSGEWVERVGNENGRRTHFYSENHQGKHDRKAKAKGVRKA